MNNSRGAVDMFNFAHGLYNDTWSAWVELTINVSITIIAGYYYGITGILLGKIISFSLISVFWKPYYLFTQAFHKSVWHYWRGMLPYYVIFALFTIHVCHITVFKYIVLVLLTIKQKVSVFFFSI